MLEGDVADCSANCLQSFLVGRLGENSKVGSAAVLILRVDSRSAEPGGTSAFASLLPLFEGSNILLYLEDVETGKNFRSK